MGSMMQREEKGIQCRCSSGSGRAMGSSAEDVGQGGLASAQRMVLDNEGDTQCGVLLEHSLR